MPREPPYRGSPTAIDRSAPALALSGTSCAIESLKRAAQALARSDVSVLICGERGTGKRQWARLIHEYCSRRDRSFIVARVEELSDETPQRSFDEGLSPDGLLTRAQEGTLYLEDLQAAPARLQRWLVAALADGRLTSIRIVSGAEPSLDRLVRVDRFSRALHDQLGLFRLQIPPLRERLHDIGTIAAEWLARRFEHERNLQGTLSQTVMTALASYMWPGNVPEFVQVLEAVTADTGRSGISAERIRAVLGRRPRRRLAAEIATLRHVECDYLFAVVARCGGNQTMAARRLGIGRTTLLRRLRTCKRLSDQVT